MKVGNNFNYGIEEQLFEFVEMQPYKTKDGRTSQVSVWRSNCVVCQQEYRFILTQKFPLYVKGVTRTCEVHRGKMKQYVKQSHQVRAETWKGKALLSVLNAVCNMESAYRPTLPADIGRYMAAQYLEEDVRNGLRLGSDQAGTRIGQVLKSLQKSGLVRKTGPKRTDGWVAVREEYAPPPKN